MKAAQPIIHIQGPPGSGKTRELAREACRLIRETGLEANAILFLALTSRNRRRLKHWFRQELRLAGLPEELSVAVEFLTLDDWLLTCLKRSTAYEDKQPALLKPLEASLIVGRILRQSLPEDAALFHAAGHGSLPNAFLRIIRQLQLTGMTPKQVEAAARQVAEPEALNRLQLLATVYGSLCQQTHAAHLFSKQELAHRALAILAEEGAQGACGDAFRSYRLILVDEAQELSAPQMQILTQLPAQLVLAGNEKLGIRGSWGGDASLLGTLHERHVVTPIPRQAAMRNNEAILSLTNTLLPQPIWEEHSIDNDQLADMLRFRSYKEPSDEAEALATAIQGFVRAEDDEASHIHWRDCVVLLRSTRYKRLLVDVFIQHNIPFQSDGWSDEVVRFQNRFHDMLVVLSGWQTLGLAAENMGMSLADSVLDAHSVVFLDEWIHRNNRYLVRWLEGWLSEQGDGADDIRHVRSLLASEANLHAEAGKWLLPDLLDAATTPPAIFEAVSYLVAAYRSYLESACPTTLLDRLLMTGESVSAELTSLKALGELSQSLREQLSDFQDALLRVSQSYQQVVGESITLAELLAQYGGLWASVGRSGSTQLPDRVRILSLHEAQGEEFPVVCIPFMVSEEFPYRRDSAEILDEAAQAALGLDLASVVDEPEERRLLAMAMTRATQRLILTCHEKESGETVLPSPYFETLRAEAVRRLGTSPDLATDTKIGNEPEAAFDRAPLEAEAVGLYEGQSAWAALLPQEPEPLFAPDARLDLSASAIKTYMTCPRQFYYKHLLRLPQASSDAASLGTLIHKVLEVFNRQAQPGNYTAERLQQVAESFFAFEDEDAFYAAGFESLDKRMLESMSPLALSALRIRLFAAIEDLVAKGYFDRYGTALAVQAEKELSSIAIDGIERCTFKGKIDALIQLADGTWEIIDYKTYGSAYKASWATCETNFLKTLEPLPEDEEGEPLSHQDRFQSKLSPVYPADYQLPLYYMACSQQERYAGRLAGISMQLVRPAFVNPPDQGAIRLGIDSAELEAAKNQVVQDINQYIVQPVLSGTVFATEPSPAACGYCPYADICENGETAESEEGSDA